MDDRPSNWPKHLEIYRSRHGVTIDPPCSSAVRLVLTIVCYRNVLLCEQLRDGISRAAYIASTIRVFALRVVFLEFLLRLGCRRRGHRASDITDDVSLGC